MADEKPEKYWYLQFEPGDWMKDPRLSMCSPATRGIWIDAICAMHSSDRSGSLTGTPDQLARVLRCTPSEVLSAIGEIESTKTADVRRSNGLVTLINRRMQREYQARLNDRERQRRRRGHAGVTPDSSTESESYPDSEPKKARAEAPPKPPPDEPEEPTETDPPPEVQTSIANGHPSAAAGFLDDAELIERELNARIAAESGTADDTDAADPAGPLAEEPLARANGRRKVALAGTAETPGLKLALQSLSDWSEAAPTAGGRAKPLMPEMNEHNPVYRMLADLARAAPTILWRGSQVASHTLIPQAIQALRAKGKEFTSAKFACGCVKSELIHWSEAGVSMPGGKTAVPQAPKAGRW